MSFAKSLYEQARTSVFTEIAVVALAVPVLVFAKVAKRIVLALPQPWGYGPKGRSGDVNP